MDREPPVTLFVIGIDRWRAEADWPLPGTQYRPYYLHQSWTGQTPSWRGTLSTSRRATSRRTCTCTTRCAQSRPLAVRSCSLVATRMGPRSTAVELRDDVLVYSTSVLDQPVEVTGPIELRLFVASSARDAYFTGKLVDLYPDGR